MIFEKSDAKKYSEKVRKEMIELISSKTDIIYQYVLGVYEKEIKLALDRDPDNKLVKIYIPRKYRKVKISELYLANEYLKEKFAFFGFDVRLCIHNCGICPLQLFGCEDQYYMIIPL